MIGHGTVLATASPSGNQQSSSAPQLVVGQRAYDIVVLPPLTETLRSETMKLLEDYAANGGQIISCGPPPALVDGRPSERGAKLAEKPGWKQVDPAGATELLVPVLDRDHCVIRRADGDKGILFHQRRQLADGELLLLVNTSIESPSQGIVEALAKGVQKWDLFTGSVSAYPLTSENGAAKLAFDLPPCGSLLLFLAKESTESGQAVEAKGTAIAPSGPLQIRRIAPNVLTLDYVDITAGGETQKNLYYNRANRLVWQKNGLPQNPWDSAVQYKDELISKKFPAGQWFRGHVPIHDRRSGAETAVHRRRTARPVHDLVQRNADHRGQGRLVARQGVWQDRHHRGGQGG